MMEHLVLLDYLREQLRQSKQKPRVLQDGTEVPDIGYAHKLVVKTRAPQKYKLVDLETGEEYIGNPPGQKYSWRKIKSKD